MSDGWQRLDSRMIWVDAARSLLSLTPAGLAVALGVPQSSATLWPVGVIAVVGVTGAVNDALRWVKTRYRITDELVERRTGLLVRRYRSIRRDRIRSVDTSARLRHRLAGLRLVTIGAGQQQSAGQPALSLDAVSRQVAEQLRQELLGPVPAAGAVEPAGERQLLARVRWRWVVYNVFTSWAYLAAAGLLWGTYWLGNTFGLDLRELVEGLLDWRRLGWGWSAAIGLAAVGAVGVAVLAASFVAENWRFQLVRVPGRDGPVLRTSQGLFKTRVINRDETRLRGVEVAEPVLWRWMGMADTNVITTGLSIWSLQPATTILPRGPVGVAQRVAHAVLGADPSPLAVPLRRHPPAALRRRVGRAVLVTAVVTGGLGWLGGTVGPVPNRLWLAGPALLPVALLAAVVAHRALGHALSGDYLVVRSGLVSRRTAALQTRAVVGWRLRQSLLQRWLGLASLTATTAAGNGQYQALDLPAADVVALADRAVPGLLAPFLLDQPAAAPVRR